MIVEKPPDGLVVTVVVTDLGGKTAFGYTDPHGTSYCVIDNAVRDGDPAARAAAFDEFLTQAAVQAARTR